MCIQLYTRLNKYLLNYRSTNYSKRMNTMKPLEDAYREFSPWQVYFLWLKHQREVFIQVGFTQYLLAWVRCGCLSKSGHVNPGSLKERDAYWNPVKCIYPCGEIHADYTTFYFYRISKAGRKNHIYWALSLGWAPGQSHHKQWWSGQCYDSHWMEKLRLKGFIQNHTAGKGLNRLSDRRTFWSTVRRL